MTVYPNISFILTVSSWLSTRLLDPAISLTNPDQESSSALPTSAIPTASTLLPLPSGMDTSS